ncbi:dienelactone hydrolase family protein [Thalassospira sp.]|uniref:dienelactone hydrolase family protein n=1 Tax=Thalassospira sp. TaxID=1912094 RepID=UPI00273610B8|nr:dienelactone hydrolase family protein [Thalassospira sp.]MDP2698272.1 dienelactone hydrolase family protein [Thalassospira sp.]
MSDTLAIETADGTFWAYVARPAVQPAPVIVVIQEIFGVNDVMRAIADDYAAQGYVAVCPDLFWRQEPGVQLTDQTQEEWDRAFGFYQGFDVNAGVADIGATLTASHAMAGTTGKAGVVGFCLGGLLTFLSAARTDGDAFVSYYGGGTDQYLNDAGTITRPLLMHLAGEDEYIPAAAQEKIVTALSGHKQVEIHSYSGRQHAFARVGGAHYHAGDAKIANDRTAAFFKKHLS